MAAVVVVIFSLIVVCVYRVREYYGVEFRYLCVITIASATLFNIYMESCVVLRERSGFVLPPVVVAVLVVVYYCIGIAVLFRFWLWDVTFTVAPSC